MGAEPLNSAPIFFRATLLDFWKSLTNHDTQVLLGGCLIPLIILPRPYQHDAVHMRGHSDGLIEVDTSQFGQQVIHCFEAQSQSPFQGQQRTA